jgi:hypothetical protein
VTRPVLRRRARAPGLSATAPSTRASSHDRPATCERSSAETSNERSPQPSPDLASAHRPLLGAPLGSHAPTFRRSRCPTSAAEG